MDDSSRIPVHVLSGFLGVGKTTAVRDLLARRAGHERIAVVVNEFGELGIDGALLSDCASCVLKEVPGGCVCCTAIADLEASIEELLGIVAPTRLLVEPTGLARPSEIVDLFRRERFASRFEIRPVVTLLDPQQDLPRLYAEEGLFRDQVDVGDILVIHRCDLASEEEIVAAEAFAAALTPRKLMVVRAALGALPDTVFDTPPVGREVERAEAARPSLLPALEAPAGGTAAGVEGYEGHGFGRGPDRVFDADRLDAVLASLLGQTLGLTGEVARAKGIFRTTTGWSVREIAGGRATTAETAYRRDSRFDVILRHPGVRDFEALDRALVEALLPEGAPVLSIEDGNGLVRAWDAAGLKALGTGDVPLPLARLLTSAGAPDTPWLWLVSEGGLFGAGGPREVLEKGHILVEEGDEPFRFLLPDGVAGGAEEELDTCRDVPALCAVRVSEAPG